MTTLPIHYNSWVVAISLAIAILASYSALVAASKMYRAEGSIRTFWILAGSFVMGCGVWSMHFVGMLALHIDVPIHYDWPMTLLSGGASILSSYIAFRATMREETSIVKLTAGGLFMGAGIVAMHYTGMAAVRSDVMLSYDPFMLGVSVFIALAASYAALLLFRHFRFSSDFSLWKLVSSVVMGLAVCGMHYSGMAASRFHSGMIPSAHAGSDPDSVRFLVAGVSVAAILIVGTLIGAVFFDRNVLERMAYQDTLTGLTNRNGLNRFFQKWLLEGMQGAVFFMDLDRFKNVNDTLGHDVGDQLLQDLAGRLQAAAGHMEKAELFRLGGDEFLLAYAGAQREEAWELAERILKELKQPFTIGDNVLYMTASIGIGLAPEHGSERSALMKAADTALYRAKSQGKNRICFYDERMEREQLRRMRLERDLRKAHAEKQFFLVYQPKWDSVSDRLCGMEALLRWSHPELGVVSPAEFIPIAEETGLIIPITEWVIRQVCRQNASWRKEGVADVPVSVNLSMRMFEREDLDRSINQALEEAGLPGESLEMEITESVAMNRASDVVGQLKRIRELGVRVSMDDFGTGYSSLGSLDEMPVDTLKIDQIFIRKSNVRSKQAIISNIISIARNLELEVVAEGVETQDQLNFLQSKGCRIIQGYYYGKPMRTEELEAWIRNRGSRT